MDKRQHLIETAFELFYQQGIHAVGINQILQASGIAKKTLYRHFDSKESLIIAVLAYRDQTFFNWLKGRVKQVKPGLDGIKALFSALDDWINNRDPALIQFHGCFFINACGEFGEPTHRVHQQSAQHKQRIKNLIAEQVAALALNQQQKTFLVNTICLLKEGVIVQAQVTGDNQSAQKAVAAIDHLLQQPSQ